MRRFLKQTNQERSGNCSQFIAKVKALGAKKTAHKKIKTEMFVLATKELTKPLDMMFREKR